MDSVLLLSLDCRFLSGIISKWLFLKNGGGERGENERLLIDLPADAVGNDTAIVSLERVWHKLQVFSSAALAPNFR